MVNTAQTPPPPTPGQTPSQRLIEVRKSLKKLEESCGQDNPVGSELVNIVATVDEVIQAVVMLDLRSWRDNNSELQSDMQRERQRVREIKPNDEKGPHHITMKRPTGF
jgi:hypothetical protein